MNIVRPFLYEEYMGSFEDFGGDYQVKMYMNPPTARRLGPWARALSDKEGNWYIAESPDDNRINGVTHSLMLGFIQSEGYAKDMKWIIDMKAVGYETGMGGYYENGIGWQQVNNTNKFYISESYHPEWVYNNTELLEELAAPIRQKGAKLYFHKIGYGVS